MNQRDRQLARWKRQHHSYTTAIVQLKKGLRMAKRRLARLLAGKEPARRSPRPNRHGKGLT